MHQLIFAILLIPILFAARFFIYSNLENFAEFSNLTTQTLNTFQTYGAPPKDQTIPPTSNTATAQISFSILPDLEPPLPPTIQKIGAPLDEYTYNITLLSEYDADIFINNVRSGKVQNLDGTLTVALHLELGDNLFQFSAKDFSLNHSSTSEIILRLSPDEYAENKFTIIQIPVAKPIPVYYPIETISPTITSTSSSGGGGSGSSSNNAVPQIVVQTLQLYSTPTYPPNFQNPDGTYIPEGSHYLPIPTYLPISLYLPPGTYLPGGAYTPNGTSYIYPETVLPFFSYLPIGTYLPGGAYLPTSPYEAQSQNIPSWIDSKMIFIIGENIPLIGNILLAPSKFITLKNDGVLQYYKTLPLSTSNSTFMSNNNFANPFLEQIKSPNTIDAQTTLQTTVETEIKLNEELRPSEPQNQPEIQTEIEVETVIPSEELSNPSIEVIENEDIESLISQSISSETYDIASIEAEIKNDFTYNSINILKEDLVLIESFELPSDLLLIEPTKIHESLTLPAPLILSGELTLQDDLVLPEDMILPKEGIKLPKNTSLKRWESFLHSLLYANLVLPRFENSNDMIVLSQGTIIPKGTILPPRTELPKGTVLPVNTIFPKGTVLPKGTILPPKTILFKGTTIYLKNTAPKGVELITDDTEEKITKSRIPRPNDTKHPEIPLPPPAEIAQGIRSPGEFIKNPIAGLIYSATTCNNNWILCQINWLLILLILFLFSTGIMLYKTKIFKKISKFISTSR